MVSPVNVRLPAPVAESLLAFTQRNDVSKSAVISTALSEWLRLQGHPQVHFVEPIPGERRAALTNGPEIWSVAEAWLQLPKDQRTITSVSESTGLRSDQVEAALAYWADNREEVDGLITRIHAAQEEAHSAWLRRQALNTLE
ncbi:MAG: hypothetical protein LBO75_03005 [Bifidobacteriaceae bacterium]|jgi:hypothetical protein|nr:hypothetical protein [Bifidobacteriaceae bacterium]